MHSNDSLFLTVNYTDTVSHVYIVGGFLMLQMISNIKFNNKALTVVALKQKT